jgi:hypothetical protein
MQNPDPNELIDKALAGRLTPEELARHPELAEDTALGHVLKSLPAPPKVSSNFTALVMQEVRREQARPARSPFRWLRWPRLAPVTAALALGGVLILTAVQHRQSLQNTKTAETIAGGVTAVASAEMDPKSVVAVFKDFDTIRSLPDTGSTVDYGLLAALRTQ